MVSPLASALPHAPVWVVVHALPLAAATTTKKGGGSFLLPLLLLVGVTALFFNGRRNRAKVAAQRSDSVAVGREVLLAGGVYGRIVAIDGPILQVEVAAGVVLRVAERGIAQVLPLDAPDDPAADGTPAAGGAAPAAPSPGPAVEPTEPRPDSTGGQPDAERGGPAGS